MFHSAEEVCFVLVLCRNSVLNLIIMMKRMMMKRPRLIRVLASTKANLTHTAATTRLL